MTISEATWQFVRQHASHDVGQLALRGSKDASVDLPMALQLIQGRQLAARKLPSWTAIDRLIYPPHLSLEQCSSEQTARYKAKITGALLAKGSNGKSSKLIDLTGGFGVDFSFMAHQFAEAVYVECQPELFSIVQQNLQLLFPPEAADAGAPRISCACTDGVDFLRQLEGHASLIFLDPARRNEHGGRTYSISDCTPDVLPLMDQLLQKADHVLLKLSPMLDWRKAVADVGSQHVEQVHIISGAGECKELLLLLSLHATTEKRLYCVNDDSTEVFTFNDISSSHEGVIATEAHVMPGAFLYEPNASLMKAGVFTELAQRYGVLPLAPNSHLFVSPLSVQAFPGRSFLITDVSTMNKQELKQKILPLKQANISVRNFPLSVPELRRKLKLADGGSHYLFATTLSSGDHVLLVCQKNPTPNS